VSEPYVKVHIANTGLHYGQAIFEGLKAFAWEDGSIRVFRPQDNAKRLRMSAERLLMTPFPEDRFVEAVKKVVADNAEFVPPFGTGGSLYIRPLLFGSGPRIGLSPADEYTLLILVIPVGCVSFGFGVWGLGRRLCVNLTNLLYLQRRVLITFVYQFIQSTPTK